MGECVLSVCNNGCTGISREVHFKEVIMMLFLYFLDVEQIQQRILHYQYFPYEGSQCSKVLWNETSVEVYWQTSCLLWTKSSKNRIWKLQEK